MSPPKKDRKIQASGGNFGAGEGNSNGGNEVGSAEFARVIADALHRDFGGTHAAVKTVVALTHANERAVKNWFSAKNGPTGRHLVDLVRSSDQVFEAVLRLSGRVDVIAAKKLVDCKQTLLRMLELAKDL